MAEKDGKRGILQCQIAQVTRKKEMERRFSCSWSQTWQIKPTAAAAAAAEAAWWEDTEVNNG